MEQENQLSRSSDGHGRFLSLFVREQRKIYSYVLMMVHNHADAEDLMQETAIVLWEKFSEYDSDRSFYAWSVGIARNVVLRFRERNRQRRVVLNEQIYEYLEHFVDSQHPYDEDMGGALRACVSKLKKADRDLIDLRYVEQVPVRQIASRIDRSLNGLYQSYSRIHTLLQTCLQRRLKTQGL